MIDESLSMPDKGICKLHSPQTRVCITILNSNWKKFSINNNNNNRYGKLQRNLKKFSKLKL